MKVYWVVIELKNLLRERLLVGIIITAMVLAGLAFLNGQRWQQHQQDVISTALLEQQRSVDKAEEKLRQKRNNPSQEINWWDDVTDIRGYAFYLMIDYAVKPPSQLAALAVGQSDLYPFFLKMNVGDRQSFINSYEIVHPLRLAMGRFDLTFFIIYLLPLLLIAMNFNAFSDEKYNGLLNVMVVQGGSPLSLCMHQIVVRSLCLLLPVFLMVVFFMTIYGFAWHLMGQLSLFFLWALSFFLYCLFWCLLSAYVISFGRPSNNNALMLTACWLVLVVLIPLLINAVTSVVYPSPSRIDYINQLRIVTDDVQKNKAKVMQRYYSDHPELSAQTNDSDYTTSKLASTQAIEARMQPLEQQFATSVERQHTFMSWLQYLSPATIVQSIFYQVTGNGLQRHREFIKKVDQHHQALRQYFQQKNERLKQNLDFVPCNRCVNAITFLSFRELPRFEHDSAIQHDTNVAGLFIIFIVTGCFLQLARQRMATVSLIAD